MVTEKNKYSKLRFGWTGTKRYLSTFGRKCEKSIYTIAELLGGVIITLTMTQIKWIFKDGNLINFSILDYFYYISLFGGLFLFGYGRNNKGRDFQNINFEKKELQSTILENKNIHEENERKLRQLSEEVIQSKQEHSNMLENFIKHWLKASMQALKIDTTSYRVTIYVHEKGKFLYLSRYSKSTSNSELHSIDFKLNQGVISKAWNNGEHFDIDKCPDYHKFPEQYKEYIHTTYEYSYEKIESLTMKSCQYVAYRIYDETGPKAVIVFENDRRTGEILNSTKAKKITQYCETHNTQLLFYIRVGIKYNTLGMKSRTNDSEQASRIEEKMLATYKSEKRGAV